MYKDIANFLKESSEWVESWFNIPVKAKYIQNPLMIPEIMANILNHIPLRYCKGVCKLWNREIDFALYDLHQKQESLVELLTGRVGSGQRLTRPEASGRVG